MTQSFYNLIVSCSTNSNGFYSLRQLCFTGLGPRQGIRKSSKRWCFCSNHRKGQADLVRALWSPNVLLWKGRFVLLHFLFIWLTNSESFPFFVDLVNQFSKIRVMLRQIALSKTAVPFCHVHAAKQQPSYWTWLNREAWALSKQPASRVCCSPQTLPLCTVKQHSFEGLLLPFWSYLQIYLPSHPAHQVLDCLCEMWSQDKNLKRPGPASVFGLIPSYRVFPAKQCKWMSS